MIDTPAALAELVIDVARHPVLGVDTESNSLFAFRQRVCLLQIATPEADYVVDPLAVDLRPLRPAFADPRIEKILHAADNDLVALKRDYSFGFANVFDTMHAARVLGLPKVGLADLLADQLGVRHSKSHQRANWGRRPLTAEMVEYAQLDIHHLIRLREKLASQLDATGRWPLAQEDFRWIAAASGTASSVPDLDIWRIGGAHDLSPEQRAVLQRLVEYRHRLAEERDVPLFKVLGDKTLMAIATAQPHTGAGLSRLPGMSPEAMRSHGEALLREVREGQDETPIPLPDPPPHDEPYHARIDVLKEWRKGRARALDVQNDIVLRRDVLEAIARRNPATNSDLADVMHAVPHRFSLFGAEILRALSAPRTS